MSSRLRLFYFPLACMMLGVIVLITHLLFYAGYGLDLTDEGFYLILIEHPSQFSTTLSQFGYIYHPIYWMVNGDISLLRIWNYLFTYCFAVVLSYLLLKSNFTNIHFSNNLQIFLISLIIGTGSLWLMCFELAQSPSYNSLAFQSLLIGAIGILLSNSDEKRRYFCGDILIGFSWWLAFLAKPTTALALGLLSFLNYISSNRSNKNFFLTPIVVAIVLTISFALSIDGSIHAFTNRIITSIRNSQTLGSQSSIYSVLSWGKLSLDGYSIDPMIYLSPVVAIFIHCITKKNLGLNVITLIVCTIASVISIGLFFNLFSFVPLGRYYGLLILAFPICCVLLIAFEIVLKKRNQIRLEKIISSAIFFLLPFAYAFGTDRPYWLNAEGASLFWILSGLILISQLESFKQQFSMLLLACGFVILMASIFISHNIEFPMRQTKSLHDNQNAIAVGKDDYLINVGSDFAEYLLGLKKIAKEGRFEYGTPIIDLTGSSPGVVYVLGGKAPGAPWLLGGYPGSDAFAQAALDKVSCDQLVRSWVLFSPDQASRLSDNLLDRYGITLKNDYVDLGRAIRPPTPFPDRYSHHLLKPKRQVDEGISKCESKLKQN
ncbi:hypothetical protein G6704_01765 [Polynucleobacter paneuropaeus]|nr:hypothetical protein G6704_01765 [Polynucleobacter paneuropaeus]